MPRRATEPRYYPSRTSYYVQHQGKQHWLAGGPQGGDTLKNAWLAFDRLMGKVPPSTPQTIAEFVERAADLFGHAKLFDQDQLNAALASVGICILVPERPPLDRLREAFGKVDWQGLTKALASGRHDQRISQFIDVDDFRESYLVPLSNDPEDDPTAKDQAGWLTWIFGRPDIALSKLQTYHGFYAGSLDEAVQTLHGLATVYPY